MTRGKNTNKEINNTLKMAAEAPILSVENVTYDPNNVESFIISVANNRFPKVDIKISSELTEKIEDK